jgi:hypothetical protein
MGLAANYSADYQGGYTSCKQALSFSTYPTHYTRQPFKAIRKAARVARRADLRRVMRVSQQRRNLIIVRKIFILSPVQGLTLGCCINWKVHHKYGAALQIMSYRQIFHCLF